MEWYGMVWNGMVMQMHAKQGGKKNGKNTLAAMTMLLQGLSDGEEVRMRRMRVAACLF